MSTLKISKTARCRSFLFPNSNRFAEAVSEDHAVPTRRHHMKKGARLFTFQRLGAGSFSPLLL
jgi:hypothetical protein